MSATLQWVDAEQTILLCRLQGAFDFSTYAVLEGELPLRAAQVAHRVDAILAMQPGAKLPPWRGLLPELRILLNILPENFGLLVGVGHGWLLSNPISVGGVSLLLHLRGWEGLRVARSVPAAQQLIQTARAKGEEKIT